MSNQHSQNELEQPTPVEEIPESDLTVNQNEKETQESSTLANKKDTQDNFVNSIFNFAQEGLNKGLNKVRELINTGGNDYMKHNLIRTINSLVKVDDFFVSHLEKALVVQVDDIQKLRNTIIEALEIISSLPNYIDGLISNNHKLNQDNNYLVNEANYWKKSYNDLYTQSQHRSRENPQIRQENSNLKSLNSELTQKNASFEKETAKLHERVNFLEKKLNEVDNERAGMLSKLGDARRNRETSYVAGGRPQNHLLIQEFKQLKDQDFHSASSNIFLHVSEANPALKKDRKLKKQELANIKMNLSNYIFIKGLELATGRNSYNADNQELSAEQLDGAVRTINEAVSSALELNENPDIVEFLKSDIKNLVKRGIKLTKKGTDSQEITGLEIESDFVKACNSISESIYSALELNLAAQALKSEIHDLVVKGLQLVKKIAIADPPGELVAFNRGQAFNSEQHEAMLGCDEEGKVDVTVFPAYIVGTRIFEKAVVLTTLEEAKISTEELREKLNDCEKANNGESDVTTQEDSLPPEQHDITEPNIIAENQVSSEDTASTCHNPVTPIPPEDTVSLGNNSVNPIPSEETVNTCTNPVTPISSEDTISLGNNSVNLIPSEETINTCTNPVNSIPSEDTVSSGDNIVDNIVNSVSSKDNYSPDDNPAHIVLPQGTSNLDNHEGGTSSSNVDQLQVKE